MFIRSLWIALVVFSNCVANTNYLCSLVIGQGKASFKNVSFFYRIFVLWLRLVTLYRLFNYPIMPEIWPTCYLEISDNHSCHSLNYFFYSIYCFLNVSKKINIFKIQSMTKLIDSNADTSYINANVHCLLGLYYSCYLME